MVVATVLYKYNDPKSKNKLNINNVVFNNKGAAFLLFLITRLDDIIISEEKKERISSSL